MDKKLEENKIKRKEDEMKEEEKKELAVARGEFTPPSTPSKDLKNVRMSLMATARNKARLLDFHKECKEQIGLPPSRLQEDISWEKI